MGFVFGITMTIVAIYVASRSLGMIFRILGAIFNKIERQVDRSMGE